MSFWWCGSDRSAIGPVTVFWGLSGWGFGRQQIWGPIWSKIYRTLLYSPPGLFPCLLGACCFGLGLVRITVLQIRVLRSIMNSNSAFLMWSSVAFLFVVSFPTKWFVWMYFASLPSVLYFVKSTIGKLHNHTALFYFSFFPYFFLFFLLLFDLYRLVIASISVRSPDKLGIILGNLFSTAIIGSGWFKYSSLRLMVVPASQCSWPG